MAKNKKKNFFFWCFCSLGCQGCIIFKNLGWRGGVNF
jgi:hypothetical protein